MKTRLILTLDETVISSAKKFAEKKGQSLSQIVESYLQSISSGSEEKDELSPKARKLRGSITLAEDFDYKSALGKSIGSLNFSNGYSDVNGLKMYYEIYGQGKPLVLIHGGGSTIQTNFGKIIPLLAKGRMIIAMELQAHGRTNDRNADLTFEQDADDVAELLKNLNIDKADFLGFSNGGTTTLQIAIRHPSMVDKIILGSPLAKRNGVPDGFWDFMKNASLQNMPELLKVGYKKVASNSKDLKVMHKRDVQRMLNFKDIPDHQIQSITAPALIIIGDKDVITAEHALELHRQIFDSQLAIIPGKHGEYIGEITTITQGFKESELVIPMIEKFLDSEQVK